MQLKTVDELRQHYKPPSEVAANKAMSSFDEHSLMFLSRCPYFILSSINEDGFIDSTPRGGEPGFIHVTDKSTFIVGDSKGNNRIDSLTNIIANPNIGLMFMIPGVDEVIRVKARASIHVDDELIKRVSLGKFKACSVIKFEVVELFYHCGKASIRSKLWQDTYRLPPKTLPSLSQVLKDQQQLKISPLTHEEVNQRYFESL